MELPEHVLTGTADVVLTNDDKSFAFTLMSAAGPVARLRFELDDISSFITHLCQVVAMVHPEPRPTSKPVALPALGVALGGSDDPRTSRFVLRLAGMDLDFSLTTETTAELADVLEGMARSARTLSASGPVQ